MRFEVVAVIGLFVISCSKGNQASSEDDNLRQKYGPVIFVNLLVRHGDRTIIKSYETDPYKNSSLWAKGFAQLTQAGLRRQYMLGEWIRKKYPDLVGDEYNYNNIYVRSSDKDRCLMSAQCSMAGMYPVKQGSALSFQPVPVHTIKGSDKMVMTNVVCPVYNEEQRNLMASPFMVNKNHELKDLFENLTKYTGEEINTIESVGVLYDTLSIQEKQMNLTLPEWTKCCYPEPMKELSKFGFALYVYTEAMRRIKAGPLLYDMVNHMSRKADATLQPNRKMWAYFAHDQTIVDILDALGLFKEPYHIPTYSSLFAMELRQKDQQHYVTLSYKDGEEDSAKQLKMPGCNDGVCTLRDFLDKTSDEAVSDKEWKSVCYGTESDKQSYYVLNNNKGLIPDWIFYISLGLMPSLILGFYLSVKPKKVMIKYEKLMSEQQ